MLKKDYLEAYEAPLVTTQLLEVTAPLCGSNSVDPVIVDDDEEWTIKS